MGIAMTPLIGAGVTVRRDFQVACVTILQRCVIGSGRHSGTTHGTGRGTKPLALPLTLALPHALPLSFALPLALS